MDNTTGAVRDVMDIAEITALLRDRLDRTGWPRTMRVFFRRRRLAPGEKPTLFHMRGYKYTAFVTNTATLTPRLLDARHRANGGRPWPGARSAGAVAVPGREHVTGRRGRPAQRVRAPVSTTDDEGLGGSPSAWSVTTSLGYSRGSTPLHSRISSPARRWWNEPIGTSPRGPLSQAV